jgi:hypothetical protein
LTRPENRAQKKPTTLRAADFFCVEHETRFELAKQAYPRRDPHVGKEMLGFISLRNFA